MSTSKYLRAVKSDEGFEVWVTGEIGVDVQAVNVIAALQFAAQQGEIPILNIYSHGGMVDDANAFYGKVEKAGIKAHVRIWGTAMSAAVTYAAAFGRENIEIHPLATVMIHETSGGTDEMREIGNNGIAAVVRKLTGIGEKKIREMMAATTTLSASEAVAMGFAGKVMKSELKLAAMYDAKPFNTNTPSTMSIKGKLSELLKAANDLVNGEADPGDESPEVKAAKEALAQATSDRQAAEAKVTELTDAEAAAQAKIAELTTAKEAAEAAKATAEQAATEVTAKFTAEAEKTKALQAEVDKLRKLPTVPATKAQAGEGAQEPGATGPVLTDGQKQVKNIIDGMTPGERSALKKAAQRKAAQAK